MKFILPSLLLTLLLFSCKSVPDQVKDNREEFIKAGQEFAKPPDMNGIRNLIDQFSGDNVEAKMKHLGVDEIVTIFELGSSNYPKLDSVVVFKKSNYAVLYDFAKLTRNTNLIQQQSGLKNFEKIEERLYIGRN